MEKRVEGSFFLRAELRVLVVSLRALGMYMYYSLNSLKGFYRGVL